jgi:hypothetical protein
VFQWTTTEDLKQLVTAELAVPVGQQRLFFRNVELQNGKLLDDYNIFAKDRRH